jgi:hypothetical protein
MKCLNILFCLAVVGCATVPEGRSQELRRAEAEIRGLKEELWKAQSELAMAYRTAGESEMAPMASTPFARLSDFRLAVIGYADAQGSEPYNDALGYRRAQSVASALLSEGIDAGRMTIESMGEAFGETPNANERQIERRVVVLLSVEASE